MLAPLKDVRPPLQRPRAAAGKNSPPRPDADVTRANVSGQVIINYRFIIMLGIFIGNVLKLYINKIKIELYYCPVHTCEGLALPGRS